MLFTTKLSKILAISARLKAFAIAKEKLCRVRSQWSLTGTTGELNTVIFVDTDILRIGETRVQRTRLFVTRNG